MRVRGFLNSDPPKIAEIWAAQPPSRGVSHVVNASMLEDYVYSRPYFDPRGLLVAENGDAQLVGFAHAGFGPNDEETNIDPTVGVISLVLVDDGVDFEAVGTKLIDEAERYLQARGAEVIYGGSVRPLNPFYLGFYGGSELPGLLTSQAALIELLKSRGYTESDATVTLECDLSRARPPLDRRQLQNRRRYRVELQTSVPARSWWDACTAPPTEVQRFVLYRSSDGTEVAHVCFWEVQPLSVSRGVLTAGLTELFVDERERRQGLAMLLNAEAMKQLKAQRFQVVEAQTMKRNVAAISLYERLGFQRVDEGVILRKS